MDEDVDVDVDVGVGVGVAGVGEGEGAAPAPAAEASATSSRAAHPAASRRRTAAMRIGVPTARPVPRGCLLPAAPWRGSGDRGPGL
ncbi:hypothetical protein [Streptomyces sp. NPDC047718]|uniref:hypothetical protein n=1 Tax=Streptomyces sp. NPDC047718 TaxID=3155479 RepID=UPI0033DD8696